MAMRGHNNRLLDPSEPNNPACAEGAYLNLFIALGLVTNDEAMSSAATASIEIVDCTGTMVH